MSEKIRILLIDDHTLFRSGIKALLARQTDCEVVGEAADGLSGLKLIEQTRPDVVLLDLDMPVMNGRETLAQIMSVHPEQTVLMLTISEDGDDLTECMRLGARGYLLKNIHADFLIEAVKKAYHGDNIFSPEMTARLVQSLIRPHQPESTPLVELSARELENFGAFERRAQQQNHCAASGFGGIDGESACAEYFAQAGTGQPRAGCRVCRAAQYSAAGFGKTQ